MGWGWGKPAFSQFFLTPSLSKVKTGEEVARSDLGFGNQMTKMSIPAQSVLSIVVAIAALESDKIHGSTHPLKSKRIHGSAYPALPLLSSPLISWKYCIVDPPTNQVIISNQSQIVDFVLFHGFTYKTLNVTMCH